MSIDEMVRMLLLDGRLGCLVYGRFHFSGFLSCTYILSSLFHTSSDKIDRDSDESDVEPSREASIF